MKAERPRSSGRTGRRCGACESGRLFANLLSLHFFPALPSIFSSSLPFPHSFSLSFPPLHHLLPSPSSFPPLPLLSFPAFFSPSLSFPALPFPSLSFPPLFSLSFPSLPPSPPLFSPLSPPLPPLFSPPSFLPSLPLPSPSHHRSRFPDRASAFCPQQLEACLRQKRLARFLILVQVGLKARRAVPGASQRALQKAARPRGPVGQPRGGEARRGGRLREARQVLRQQRRSGTMCEARQRAREGRQRRSGGRAEQRAAQGRPEGGVSGWGADRSDRGGEGGGGRWHHEQAGIFLRREGCVCVLFKLLILFTMIRVTSSFIHSVNSFLSTSVLSI